MCVFGGGHLIKGENLWPSVLLRVVKSVGLGKHQQVHRHKLKHKNGLLQPFTVIQAMLVNAQSGEERHIRNLHTAANGESPPISDPRSDRS